MATFPRQKILRHCKRYRIRIQCRCHPNQLRLTDYSHLDGSIDCVIVGWWHIVWWLARPTFRDLHGTKLHTDPCFDSEDEGAQGRICDAHKNSKSLELVAVEDCVLLKRGSVGILLSRPCFRAWQHQGCKHYEGKTGRWMASFSKSGELVWDFSRVMQSSADAEIIRE